MQNRDPKPQTSRPVYGRGCSGPTIQVRSLRCVGGTRASAKYTRRANRRAREAGYADHAALLAAAALLLKGEV